MNNAGQYYLFESVAFGIPVYWDRNHFPWVFVMGNLFLQLQELKLFFKNQFHRKIKQIYLIDLNLIAIQKYAT
jgi:hypothetical protein